MLCRSVTAFVLTAFFLAACDKDTPSSPTTVVQPGPTVISGPTASGPQSLEGPIESIAAPDRITIGGQSITLNSGATIRSGSMRLAFADLRVGARARVAAERDASGTMRTSLVEVLDAVGTPTSTHGIIQGFTGNGDGYEFRFGGQLVRGDGNTRILDRGQPVAVSSLRDGVSADVSGVLLSDRLQAMTIGIDSATQTGPPTAAPPTGPSPSPPTGPSPTPPTEPSPTTPTGPGGDEVTITGVFGPISGTCPVITFPISGRVVVTNSGTAFVGGSCAGLTAGGSAEVTGTQAGNVVVARTVTVK